MPLREFRKPRPAPPIAEPDELGELTHDAIAGDFRITQRRRGHRYSLDDVLTAWEAANSAPTARMCLELGSGIGSVLLMLAYKLPSAHFVAIEAQRNSFRLLTRNVEQNALGERVTLLHGDLRDEAEAPALSARFELVTGTPPYVPPGRATPSSDSQRAYARQELRGGVEDYLSAVGRTLAPSGSAVVCADARFPERVFAGAERAQLSVIRQRDVVPRAGSKGALFALFTLMHKGVATPACERVPAWVARDEAGARTVDYLAVRAFFGISAPRDELPSP
jgi:tRNA1Val (adenine37-N6)-methyltransferase